MENTKLNHQVRVWNLRNVSSKENLEMYSFEPNCDLPAIPWAWSFHSNSLMQMTGRIVLMGFTFLPKTRNRCHCHKKNPLSIVLWLCLCKRILQMVRICYRCCTQDLTASVWVCGCVCICAMSVCFLCGCNIIMFCLFLTKWSDQLWQSVCDSWSGVHQSTSQIFGTLNRNWAVREVQEVIQCGTYCSVLHLYQQFYLQRFMELNVC